MTKLPVCCNCGVQLESETLRCFPSDNTRTEVSNSINQKYKEDFRLAMKYKYCDISKGYRRYLSPKIALNTFLELPTITQFQGHLFCCVDCKKYLKNLILKTTMDFFQKEEMIWEIKKKMTTLKKLLEIEQPKQL